MALSVGLVASGLASLAVLAPSSAAAGGCVPGAQVACACAGGGSGVQVCADDGSRLGACQCAAVAPPPAPPAVPRPGEATPPVYYPVTPPAYYPATPAAPACADPADPRCAGSSTVLVPITFKRPGRVMVEGYVGGAFAAGVSPEPSYHIYGGGVDAGTSLLVGFQHFPDREGGNWQGLDVRVLAGFYGAGVVYPNTGAGMVMAMGSAVVGYEFFHLGKLDSTEFTQRGIGGFVGARVGFQWSELIGNQTTGGVDPTVGAVASLVIPTFQAQRGRLKAGLVNFGFWVLPGTAITFYTVGGGAEF